MNRAYRLIWSALRQTTVVVAETTRGRGKQGGRASAVAGTVAAALLALQATDALAACVVAPGVMNTISTAETGPCNMTAGSSIAIDATGAVSGAAVGISNINLSAGGISNSGSILGSATGIKLDTQATLTGSIWNSGTIQGGTQAIAVLDGSQIVGDIVNTGTVAGGVAINQSSSLGGSIVNSGTVSSSFFALSITNAAALSGGITNTGLVSGNWTAIYVTYSSIAGAIQNTNNVHGGLVGLLLGYTSSIAGGINNSGTLIGDSQNGLVVSNGTLVANGVTNSGLIHGGLSGIGVLANASITGGLANSGTISGGTYAINLSSSTLDGGIINLSGGVVSATGVNGVAVIIDNSDVSGGVTNAGQVSANNTFGVGLVLTNGSSINGELFNQAGGTISGNVYGARIRTSDINGGITNDGLIRGGGTGLLIQLGSTITGPVINRGTIQGLGNTGLWTSDTQFVSGITNSGLIQGNDDGVGLWGTTITDFVNLTGGTVSGLGRYGLILMSGTTLSGSIQNAGLIQGADIGVFITSDASAGAIINQAGGIISGGDTGISLYSGAAVGNIINSGTISGANIGVYADTNATISSISNSGLISGSFRSLDLPNAVAMTIDNSGTLQGDVFLGGNILNLNGSGGRVIGNTFGTGSVNVNGTFASQGTFNVGDFNIASGGRFSMNHGVISTATFDNAGTLAVPAGTVANLTGSYAQAASGTLEIGIGSATNYGRLQVSNAVSLADGGTLHAALTGTPSIANGTRLGGVVAAGVNLTANPAMLQVTDNNLFYDFSAVAGLLPQQLDLVTSQTPNALTGIVGTTNPAAKGLAKAIEKMVESGVPAPLQPAIDALGGMTPQGASDALSQMLPLLVGSAEIAMDSVLKGTNRVIQSRQEFQNGRCSGDDFLGDKQFWAKPFGGRALQDEREHRSGFEADTYGIVFGADADFDDFSRIGLGFGYASSNIDGRNSAAPNSADVDSYQLMLYGSRILSDFTEVSFQASVGRLNTEGKRGIRFMNAVSTSDYDSWVAHLGVDLAHSYTLGERTTFTPSVRADYRWLRSESYVEKGAGALNLRVGEDTTDQLALSANGMLAHRLSHNATLTANLGASYDVMNARPGIKSSLAGAPDVVFATSGLKADPLSLRGGIGIVGQVAERLEATARYDFEVKEDYHDQTASVRLKWNF